ncbi:hypothetical protein VL15_36145 [Burkholderia cepacia]|uniref:Uncharacterized protein n=1 Tax=Burkholderia cepacia TaxID=292 RepID=A0A0J5WDK7_BURCE|nr:hypothetical protein [Burkholderia cepacia]KML46111.1 hypothetical protein VL15_36145 [Burkholderia cepacia]
MFLNNGSVQGAAAVRVKANRNRIGPPLDKAIESMWGFTLNHGRHLSEGEDCSHDDTELIVGFAAAPGAYLIENECVDGKTVFKGLVILI